MDNSDPRARLSWWALMGTHYRLDAGNWLGSARGWPRHPEVGMFPDYTTRRPAGLQPVVGRFSGEKRYYDFHGRFDKVRDPRPLEEWDPETVDEDLRDVLETRRDKSPETARDDVEVVPGKDYHGAVLAAMEKGIDLVWLTGGVNYREENAIEFLLAKKGACFKDGLYEMARAFNTGVFAGKPITIYWEIGNEVNSSNRFSLRNLAPGKHLRGDPRHGRDYIEYYFAPAVEALRTASRDLFDNERGIQIILGSISGIHKEANQKFLDFILSQTIEGRHAPALAGRHVYEVIDAVTLHYSMGDRSVLEEIYARWLESGKVANLWTTEELGRRGRGDYNVALVAFRWLDFWARHGWGSRHRGRVIFWGDDLEHPACATTGRSAEALLGDFLRDYPLTQAKNVDVTVETAADVEWYALRAEAGSTGTRYAVCLHPHVEAQSALRYVELRGVATADSVAVDAKRIRANQPTESLTARTIESDQGVRIGFAKHELHPMELIVVLVTVDAH